MLRRTTSSAQVERDRSQLPLCRVAKAGEGIRPTSEGGEHSQVGSETRTGDGILRKQKSSKQTAPSMAKSRRWRKPTALGSRPALQTLTPLAPKTKTQAKSLAPWARPRPSGTAPDDGW